MLREYAIETRKFLSLLVREVDKKVFRFRVIGVIKPAAQKFFRDVDMRYGFLVLELLGL